MRRPVDRRARQHDSHEPVAAVHLQVRLDDGDQPDRAIRKFMRKVRDDGILREFTERRMFVKPSERRRTARARALVVSRRAAAALREQGPRET